MERHHNEKAARNGFVFNTAALLIWTIYSQITAGDRGWQFTIMLGGVVIYLWSRVYYSRKTK